MANPFYAQVKRDFPENDEEADDRLKAAAAKVQDTVNSEGWALIWDLIDKAESNAMKRLTNMAGEVPSRSEFARLVGYLGGLREPQSAADAFVELLEARERKQ